MRHEDILDELRSIIFKYLDSSNVRVYLFGSWARGEERVTSDIDLAVDYDQPLPPGTLAKLRMAIEESHIPYQVDIVDLRRADDNFRQHVMWEGTEWEDYVKEY